MTPMRRGSRKCGCGAARDQRGTVMVLTFGTGIGSALFVDGRLVPNTELGHLQMAGQEAEHRASARVRTAEESRLVGMGRARE